MLRRHRREDQDGDGAREKRAEGVSESLVGHGFVGGAGETVGQWWVWVGREGGCCLFLLLLLLWWWFFFLGVEIFHHSKGGGEDACLHGVNLDPVRDTGGM